MILNKFKPSNWKNTYPSNLIEYFFTPAPRGLRITNFIFQKVFGINKKFKFMVHFTSKVSGKIILGKNVVNSFCNSGGCYIQGINGIHIGNNTIFAAGVKIISSNHDLRDHNKHIKSKPVVIGENCWLGANSVILPEVELGNNVIVAAGAVVSKSFKEDNIILGGVPAKILKNIE